MFTERVIQFFCSDEQFAANEGTGVAIPLKGLELRPEKEWQDFAVACETDADCKNDPALGQACTKYHWDTIDSGESFANGAACYNWSWDVCPGNAFGAENYNYENTGWSAYQQFECTTGSGAASLAGAITAALIVAANLI